MVLLDNARNGFLNGTLDWDTQTFSAALLDLNGATDTGVRAITGATNATPIVITATAHGFSNNDFVYIDGVGGNLAANGLWRIKSVAANTFEIESVNPITGAATNATGSGAYTSGGYAVCLGPSTSGDNWDDWNGCIVNVKVNLTGTTATLGVADANDVTFTAVTGNTVEAAAIFRDTGTDSTSTLVALLTGKHIVRCNTTAATSATSIPVEPLTAGIPSGSVIVFSNGASATLSSAASAGDRSIAVNALAAAVAAGSQALAPQTGSNLPITPNGGNITLTFDSGVNRIFRL